MNRLYVLKDVAYGAKVGGGVVATTKDLPSLTQGALAIFNDKGAILTVAGAAAALADSKNVQLAVGRAEDSQLIVVSRKAINDINLGNYRAFVKPIIKVTPVATSGEGELVVKVSDTSFNSNTNIASINVSVWKKTGETHVQAIAKLVAKLNATTLVTAATADAGANFTITPKETGVVIEVSVGGLIEGALIATTTPMVYGQGLGADVLQMEKDASVEEGNGNYIDYTSEFYKRPMEASASANYDLITLSWNGVHSSPSTTKVVMHNTLSIACVDGVTPNTTLKQDTANMMALLALIFPTAYSGASAAETATDDGTDNDGVSGN